MSFFGKIREFNKIHALYTPFLGVVLSAHIVPQAAYIFTPLLLVWGARRYTGCFWQKKACIFQEKGRILIKNQKSYI